MDWDKRFLFPLTSYQGVICDDSSGCILYHMFMAILPLLASYEIFEVPRAECQKSICSWGSKRGYKTLDSTSDCKIRCNVRGDVSWNYKFRILGRSVFVESQIAFGPLQVMINAM